VIQPGDTLGGLALRFFGSSRKIGEILRENPEIKNPDLIFAGRTLILPDSMLADSGEAANRPTETEVAPVSTADSERTELPPPAPVPPPESFGESRVAQDRIALTEVLVSPAAAPEAKVQKLEEAVSRKPRDSRLRGELMAWTARSGDGAKAAEMAESLRQEKPQDAQAQIEAARFFASPAGGPNYSKALEAIRQARSIEPDNQVFMVEELSIATRSGDRGAAKEAAERVVERVPALASHPDVRKALR
jgi:predicted Zn-dependent protease